MQPELPTTAQCRALRAELNVSNTEIREHTKSEGRPSGYREDRIARVLNEGETSQPLVDTVYAALIEIRDERRAAAGDRAAMDRLDRREARPAAPLT